MDENISCNKLAANCSMRLPSPPPRGSNCSQLADIELPSSRLKYFVKKQPMNLSSNVVSLSHNYSDCINEQNRVITSSIGQPSPQMPTCHSHPLKSSTFAVSQKKLDSCYATLSKVSREHLTREAASLKWRRTHERLVGFMVTLSFIFTISQAGKFVPGHQ